jgi:hypothetical protein
VIIWLGWQALRQDDEPTGMMLSRMSRAPTGGTKQAASPASRPRTSRSPRPGPGHDAEPVAGPGAARRVRRHMAHGPGEHGFAESPDTRRRSRGRGRTHDRPVLHLGYLPAPSTLILLRQWSHLGAGGAREARTGQ